MTEPNTNPASPPASDPPGPPQDNRPLWKRIVPFLVAIALLAWLLHGLDLQAFAARIRAVNYLGFLGSCALFVVMLLSADSVATSFVYRRTVCAISFRELFVIRGASYFPSLLNHHVGQAWLTWYLSRAYRAPLWRVAGATLLVYATTFASLFLFGGVSLLFNRTEAHWLAPLLAAATVAGLGYLAVIRARPAFLAKRQVLGPLFDAGIRGHFEALALRIPHVLVLFGGTWIPFFFFGVKIPPSAAFAYVPVLMVVAALPITPQGVGTRDWFAKHYFSCYGPGTVDQQAAAVVAATLSFAAATFLLQAILSLLLMHRAMKALDPVGTPPR